MTYNPNPVPPPSFWPATVAADCWHCNRPDAVTWHGLTTILGVQVHVWYCRACDHMFFTRLTCWPVLDGPDCPVCEIPATRWTGMDPDHDGDAWTCEAGHEFVLDPEGFIYVPPAGGGAA